jgi:vacuolar-type H+-ATPase catalytic subunit A/Vma1
LDYSYSKEDKMINELLKNNEEKFNTVRDILNEEISKNKELKTNLEKVLKQKSSNNELV